MSKVRIGDIEAAIIAAIQADEGLDFVPDNQVQTFSQRSIDFATEQIIVVPPAVLVCYTGGRYNSQEITNHRYTIAESFVLVAVAKNTRGRLEAKQGDVTEPGAYEMLEALKALFGGKKITTDYGDIYSYIVGTSFEGINDDGSIAYGLEIGVRGSWDNV